MRQLLIAIALNFAALAILATEGRTQIYDPFAAGYYGGMQGLTMPAGPPPQPVNYDAQAAFERRRAAIEAQQEAQRHRYYDTINPPEVECYRASNGRVICSRTQ